MKKQITIIASLLILSSLFFTGCKHGVQGETIDLSTGWNYTLRDPFTNEAALNRLPDDKLDNLQDLIPGEKGTIWLQRNFFIPPSLKNKDISCYLGRIAIADRTYINGSLIGHEGFFPPHEFTAWNTARNYEIPETLINYAGINTLTIEIYVDGEGSIVSHPYIGLYEDTNYSAAHERFWNSQINALFAFFMLIIAFYHLMMWNKDRSQKEALYFAIINFVSVLYMSVFYLPEIPGLPTNRFPFIWFQKIFSSAMPFTVPFIINTFVNEFFKRKDKKALFILRILFLAIPILVVLFAPDYVHLRKWRMFYQPFLLPPIAYILFIISNACIKKQKDAIPLLLGFTPLLLTLILDLTLHDWLKLYYLPYFTSIGWQLVILALLFVLAGRFTNAKKQSDYLNKHLTDEVEARTKELSESNNQLTTANSELNLARQTYEKDMKLAVHVQQSFFPRWAPQVEDWDIAYKFKPAAGVAGDLYDFFTDGKHLTGAALFDVSGHGIAAGLVTMIAKNAIAHRFTSDFNVKLSTVMKGINERIIEDKGNVENYLTGILIRTSGNVVQLINAGHPVVYLRKANGKCYPVQMNGQNQDDKCALIGIREINVDFLTMQFKMEAGDALILYTDCLSESRNLADDEFGGDNISEVFAKSGEGNAQSKLNHVLDAFENFTKGVPLKDDLTVIVMQKK